MFRNVLILSSRCLLILCEEICDVCVLFCFFIMIIFAGRKGGHKGRARMYTSPEEIDAQMKAEKEKKRVCE